MLAILQNNLGSFTDGVQPTGRANAFTLAGKADTCMKLFMSVLDSMFRYPLLRLPRKSGVLVVGGGATVILTVMILAGLAGLVVLTHPELVGELAKIKSPRP